RQGPGNDRRHAFEQQEQIPACVRQRQAFHRRICVGKIMLNTILKNPMTIWLKWLVCKYWYEYKYRQRHLKIRYMTRFADCVFGNYNTLYDHSTLTQVTLGDYSYVGVNSTLFRVTVGKFCCIAPDVKAGLGRHPSRDFVSIHPAFYSPGLKTGATFTNQS